VSCEFWLKWIFEFEVTGSYQTKEHLERVVSEAPGETTLLLPAFFVFVYGPCFIFNGFLNSFAG
jgi:hypothetical protein